MIKTSVEYFSVDVGGKGLHMHAKDI